MTTKMREYVAIQRRQSEARAKFNRLDALPERSDAETTEHRQLDETLTGLEAEFRAAATAVEAETEAATVPAADAEATEYRALLKRVNVGRILGGVMERRSALDGAEAEIQVHHGLQGNQVPLDALRLPVEHRAAGITTAPTNVETMMDTPIGPVFADGVGAFLGIYRPTVAVGDQVYPVLATRPDVGGPHAGSTDVAETAATFNAELLSPERLQASFNYGRMDALRFAGMDASLRADLNAGLQEALDKEVISGDEGLLEGTNLANHNASAITTFTLYMSEFIYGRVDGRYAPTVADLRVVVGSGTFAHAGSVYRANNVDDPAAEIIGRRTGGLRVSAHVPAVVGNKQNAIIRRGMRRDMVQPLWAGVTLIVDEVTGSGKGEIEVTAVMAMNTKILRAGGFYKQQTQHA